MRDININRLIQIPVIEDRYDIEWQSRAACKGVGADFFHDMHNCPDHHGHFDWCHCLKVCDGCLVRKKCLDWINIIEQDQPTRDICGVYGGESPTTRIQRRKRSGKFSGTTSIKGIKDSA